MPAKLKASVYLVNSRGLPSLEERHIEYARARSRDIEWRAYPDPESFAASLPDADIAITWWFGNELLERAGKLKVLATPAAGRDSIEPRSGDGLEVIFGTFHGMLMAETAIGFMLAFCRGIKASLDMQATDPWPRKEVVATLRQLRGSRATIVGFGHIGKWTAKLLKPFGVRITGVNRNDMTRPDFLEPEDRVVPASELDAVLPGTDHLVMILPGGPESDGVIDARRLALLPKTAFVYNLGRGNSIGTEALAAALTAGTIAGAGLDVFEKEPLSADNPLRSCPNVILMPHVSAFAPNYIDIFMEEFIGKLSGIFPGNIIGD